MAKVEIIRSLFEEIKKKFKGETQNIIDLLETLEENPYKGKAIGQVGGIAIKELRYNSFRFYFIIDEYKIRIFSKEELSNFLIKFVRMSDKKSQQKVINEIKNILRQFGPQEF